MPNKINGAGSKGEGDLAWALKALGVPHITQHKFSDTRRWRFDVALGATASEANNIRVAIEVDGGIFSRGRHVRPRGFIGDVEKMNAAMEMGWVVLKCVPQSDVCGIMRIADLAAKLYNRHYAQH